MALSKTLAQALSRRPHPHRITSLYQLCGLEPMTADSASVSSFVQQE